MSLHKFAEQVAANGRGDDSLLVHMTPDEVQRLQAFAEANGRSLTINPETGLPEAGFLSDLFKAVAPIALGAFLGPGAFGIAGMGLSAGTAGLITGGITTLATGSLSRGLMAGLGAYGGAGLAQGFADAGVGAGMSEALAGSSSGNLSQAFGDVASVAGDGSSGQAFNEFLKSNANPATMSGADLASSGFKAAAADPMAFAKQNFGNIAAAAAPIMAGAMVPTTTKADTTKSDNYIRQFDFNINPETGKPDPLYGVRTMTPVKANEWKDKTFQGQRNLFRQQNPNPYQLGVGSLNQAPQQQQIGMAGGGIVALAGGGDYTTLTKDSSADDIASAYKQAVTASGGDTAANQKVAIDYLTNLGIGQDKIGQAYGVYQASPTYTAYTDAQMGSFFSNPANKDINLDKAIIDANANPADVNRYIASFSSPFVGSTDTTGGSGTLGIYNRMVAEGIDPNEAYAALIANNPNYKGWSLEDIQRGYNLDKGAYALSKELGGKVSDKDWVKFMDANKYSINDAAQAFVLSRNEVQRRYDAVKAAEKTIIGKDTGTGTGNDIILPTTPQTYAPPDTTNPYGNVNNPGDLTFNADGSTTVQPNIPGRPYGGFVGIQQLKDAYTKGGGSLGYTSKAPRTINEFNQLYNRQTGDSLAAYDYLMGKGGGKYPTKSGVDKLAVPYSEYALGKKTVGLKPITKTTGTDTGTFKAPQTYFDEKAYLAANPDVEAEMKAGKSNFSSAYEHWLRYGQKEGRKFAGDYDSYLSAVEAEKARIANADNSGGTGGDSGGPGGGAGPGGVGGAGGPGSTTAANPADMGAVGDADLAGGGITGYADGGVTGNGQLNLNIPLNVGNGGGGGYTPMGGGFSSGGGGGGNTSTFNGQNNTGIGGFGGGYGPAVRPDESGGLLPRNLDFGGRPRPTFDPTYTDGLGFGGRPRPTSDSLFYTDYTRVPGTATPIAGMANGGMTGYAIGGGLGSLGSYSDGGRLLRGPGDGVSDSIPATIGRKQQPARLADGEFVIPARIVSELGNGSTDAGAKKLYAMMDRVQRARGKTTGKNKVAANSRSDKYLPA